MSPQKFEKMVKAHDLTFGYSDDRQAYEGGFRSLKAIKEAAKLLPKEDVIRIWNANVDRIMAPGARQMYYWKD